MRIQYIHKNLRANKLSVIQQAIEIIDEYAAQGFMLTLRQLYYQFVARALIPNNLRSYKNLGAAVNDGRLLGYIDWDSIEDRTRNVRSTPHWDTPGQIVQACARQFTVDKWADQEFAPEVWIEKDALMGVIEPVCQEMDVPYFACRGYTSQSEQWRAGRRFLEHREGGREPVVLHLGDHDPSGVDMTRDNHDRLYLFSEGPVEVRRLALNYDQVEEYGPPPNPAKFTDSRAGEYVTRFGRESWELDALEPAVLAQLIRDELLGLLDLDLWEQAQEREAEGREELARVAREL